MEKIFGFINKGKNEPSTAGQVVQFAEIEEIRTLTVV